MKLQFKNELGKIIIISVFLNVTCIFSVNAADVSSAVKNKTEGVVFAEKVKNSLNSGSKEETLALFETMPESLKNSPDMLVLQASVLLSAGKIAEASDLVEKLKSVAPDARETAELSLLTAKLSKNRAKYAEVLSQLAQSKNGKDLANIEYAEDFLRKNKYDKATEYFLTAYQANPANSDSLIGLGKCNYYQGKFDQAKKNFSTILAKDEYNSQANLYMGKILAEENKNRSALEYARKALKSDPENYDIYIDIGSYSHQLMDYKGAEEAWTKAISIVPDFFLTYAYRASLYDEMNLFDKAYEDYKKVIQLNPKYYYAFESLGMLAWHEQDYAGSCNAFMKALEMNPDNYSYMLMVAAGLIKDGKQQQAKTFLAGALKKFDRESLEYSVIRIYHDGGGRNAENLTMLKLSKEQSSTKRKKLTYYMGLFYEINNFQERAQELYGQVLTGAPIFFEYRLAEWSVKDGQ